jgi:hypothetical protein
MNSGWVRVLKNCLELSTCSAGQVGEIANLKNEGHCAAVKIEMDDDRFAAATKRKGRAAVGL